MEHVVIFFKRAVSIYCPLRPKGATIMKVVISEQGVHKITKRDEKGAVCNYIKIAIMVQKAKMGAWSMW